MSPKFEKRDRARKRRRGHKKNNIKEYGDLKVSCSDMSRAKLKSATARENSSVAPNDAKNERGNDGNEENAATATTTTNDSSNQQPMKLQNNASTTNSPPEVKQTDSADAKLESMRMKNRKRKELRNAKKMAKQKSQQEEIKRKELETNLTMQQEKNRKEMMEEMARNAANEFQMLEMGVKYKDLYVGKQGKIVKQKTTATTPSNKDELRVSYKLRAINSKGKVLESKPNFAFRLGGSVEVIKGWEIGLEGMREGGIRHLIVPHEAGYGRRVNIGAGFGGDLYFEITLLSC